MGKCFEHPPSGTFWIRNNLCARFNAFVVSKASLKGLLSRVFCTEQALYLSSTHFSLGENPIYAGLGFWSPVALQHLWCAYCFAAHVRTVFLHYDVFVLQRFRWNELMS